MEKAHSGYLHASFVRGIGILSICFIGIRMSHLGRMGAGRGQALPAKSVCPGYCIAGRFFTKFVPRKSDGDNDFIHDDSKSND